MQMAIPSLDRSMFEPESLRELILGAKAGEAARDAAQEVFIRLHKKIGSVSEDRELGPCNSFILTRPVDICDRSRP